MRRFALALFLLLPTLALAQLDFRVGLFHQPTTDAASREALWQRCEAAGVTDLFVKTFTNGFTIYPSNPTSTFEQRPDLVGQDLLATYIEEGHARDIRIHAWVDAFLWGPDREANPDAPRHQFSEHHQWRVVNAESQTPRPMFVSPAISDVANRVQVLCLEIIHFHPMLDGLLLDQFRYPGGSDFTFDTAAVWEFMQMGLPDPRTDTSEGTRAQWRAFIEGKLGTIIEQIHLLMHGIHQRPITVSLMAFPPTEDDLRYQAWPSWVAAGNLDAVIPMCFDSEAETIAESASRSIQAMADTEAPHWIGLAVRPGSDRPSLADQLDALTPLSADGVVIFSDRSMSREPALYDLLGEWVSNRSD